VTKTKTKPHAPAPSRRPTLMNQIKSKACVGGATGVVPPMAGIRDYRPACGAAAWAGRWQQRSWTHHRSCNLPAVLAAHGVLPATDLLQDSTFRGLTGIVLAKERDLYYYTTERIVFASEIRLLWGYIKPIKRPPLNRGFAVWRLRHNTPDVGYIFFNYCSSACSSVAGLILYTSLLSTFLLVMSR
jgi:hypothetical protein